MPRLHNWKTSYKANAAKAQLLISLFDLGDAFGFRQVVLGDEFGRDEDVVLPGFHTEAQEAYQGAQCGARLLAGELLDRAIQLSIAHHDQRFGEPRRLRGSALDSL